MMLKTPTSSPQQTQSNRVRDQSGRWSVFLVAGVLVVLLVATGLTSMLVGQFALAPLDVFAAIGRKLGFSVGPESSQFADAALFNVRFPRLVLGLIVGAALGVTGALMQAVFNNPLAEPGIIGVSGGAAVGATVAIVLGSVWSLGNGFGVPFTAFVSALITTLCVYVFSRAQGKASVLSLVLTGIAVNALTGAVMAVLIFLGDTQSREQVVFWQMGSLNGSTWSQIVSLLPVIVLGLIGIALVLPKLDVLSLGEREAFHAGVHVERLKIITITTVALLTAAAVSFAGIIGFVGLIVPHILRMLTGPSNKILVPLCALGGALMVSTSDILARTIIPFADLPIGIFTALIGGPTFFVLLRRTLKKVGALS